MPGEPRGNFDPFSAPPRAAMSIEESKAIQAKVEKGRETPWACEGEPPRGAIKRIENGKEVRKDPCEDQKIKDAKRGIFAIYDGVSTAEGYKASSLVARESNAVLARPEFTQALENLRTGKNATDADIETYVRNTLSYAVRTAEEKLTLENSRVPAEKNASTTLALALIVPMRDGSSRLFYANIGDSRVGIVRDGKFLALSSEDNVASHYLEDMTNAADVEGKPGLGRRITREEALLLEQAPSLAEVPGLLAGLRPPTAHPDNVMKVARFLFSSAGRKLRNTITDYVGREQAGPRSVRVASRELKPGDALVITSDGVHDNLLDAKLAEIVNATPDEAQAERAVADAAEKEAMKANALTREEKNLQRTKGTDDISIVVRRIGALAPAKPAMKRTFMDLKAISTARAQARRRAIPLSEAVQTPAQLESIRAQKEREERIEALQDSLEHVEAEKMAIGERIPPRYGSRMKVKLPVSGEQAVISSYDAAQDVYVFETQQNSRPEIPNDVANMLPRSRRTIDRFVLESAQPLSTIPVFEGVDKVNVYNGGEAGLRQVPLEDVRRAVFAAINAGKELTLHSDRIRAKLEALKH